MCQEDPITDPPGSADPDETACAEEPPGAEDAEDQAPPAPSGDEAEEQEGTKISVRKVEKDAEPGANLVLVAKLIDQRTRKEYDINRNPFIIGRSSSNHLSMPGGAMSRVHFMVYRKHRDFFVEDLGSTNGTYAGAREVKKPVKLKDGTEIEVKSRTGHPQEGWKAAFRLVYRAVAEQE